MSRWGQSLRGERPAWVGEMGQAQQGAVASHELADHPVLPCSPAVLLVRGARPPAAAPSGQVPPRLWAARAPTSILTALLWENPRRTPAPCPHSGQLVLGSCGHCQGLGGRWGEAWRLWEKEQHAHRSPLSPEWITIPPHSLPWREVTEDPLRLGGRLTPVLGLLLKR